MAKKKKKSNLPFPLRMALSAAVKKNTNSEEEREKVMQALDSLDLNTLLHDPEALAKVMANPAGELRNFVADGVDPDAEIGENAELDSGCEEQEISDTGESCEDDDNNGDETEQV